MVKIKFSSRYIVAIIFFFINMCSQAQWKSFTVGVNGDTLNRVDAKGRKQGPWVEHQEPLRGGGGTDLQGFYMDNVKEGKWVTFSLTGDKLEERNYRWGSLDGKCNIYSRFGTLLRTESWRAIDPKKQYDTVAVYDVNDPGKIIKYVVVKVDNHSVKHGAWLYFNPENGGIVKKEMYWMNQLKTSPDEIANDDDMRPIDLSGETTPVHTLPARDTINKKNIPKPPQVVQFEKTKTKRKNRLRDGQTGI